MQQMARLLLIYPCPLLMPQPFGLSVLPLTVNEYLVGLVVALASAPPALLFPHQVRVPVVRLPLLPLLLVLASLASS